MSRIDDLIAEHCPDGVEFKPLGTLGRRNTGTSITAGKMREIQSASGPIRVFAGGNTVADVDEKSVPSKDIVREPSIIVKSRGHIGFTYYDQPFTHKSELWSYTINLPKVDQKFVYYYLLTKVDQLQALARATSVKLPQLGVADTDRLPIPVPPIDVQREIVRILDTFTQLEAELEAELEARRVQYAHFRDALLTATSGAKMGTLSDVSVNHDSKRRPVTKSAREPGAIPYYGASGIVDYVSEHILDGDYLLVSEDGANLLVRVTPIAFPITGKTWVNNHAHVLSFENPTTQRFVEIYMNSIDLSPFISGSSQPKLNQANLNRIPIPMISVEEQKRIVEMLTNFESLTNDLSIGLPAELEARRKQYAYYRDRLLTFKEVPS